MTDSDPYAIRRFRAGDLEGYRSLYDDVFGARPNEEWFRWKYRDNPYADHVPIYVAEADGTVVGARSFFALPIRVGRERFRAFQPCDTMVREDHRRRGLFTRMTEAAIDDYRDGDPDLFFNFPNSKTRAGNRKLGWRVVTEKELYYRLQNPAAVARSVGAGRKARLAAAAASPVVKGYVSARESLSGIRGEGPTVTLERHEELPVDRLESLYEEVVPDAFHVPRDDRFLRWRFRNPDWNYVTYLASSGGRDVAAIVTGTRTTGDLHKTSIIDVLSVPNVDDGVLDRLLAAVLQYNRAADLIVAMGGSIPRETLLNRGFLPDGEPPLSAVTETTTLMVRSLADDAWTLGGKAVDDANNWKTTFVSHDTD